MRIGIDGSCLANRRGFGRFARESLKALTSLDSPYEFVVVVDEPSAAGITLPKRCERLVVPVREAPTSAASSRGRRRIGDMLAMGKAVAKARLDLMYFPATYTFFPVWNVGKVVVTMHDTLALQHPDLIFPNLQGRIAWTLKEHLAVRWSDLVLTVSQASKRDLIAWFRLSERRVEVITEGPDPIFCAGEPTSESAAICEKYGLASAAGYFLYVGGLSPHKNLPRLIEGFAKAGIEGARLALVGDLGDVFLTHVPELRALIHRLNLDGRVVLTGFVPDDELVHLYRGAAALVQPSLAEGFGLPTVEAMACGTPVLASRISALTEVVGDAGLFFDPYQVNEIGDVLKRTWNDPELRNDLGRRARIRSDDFTWEKSAKMILASFGKLLGV